MTGSARGIGRWCDRHRPVLSGRPFLGGATAAVLLNRVLNCYRPARVCYTVDRGLRRSEEARPLAAQSVATSTA
jgi:hypothetical protein